MDKKLIVGGLAVVGGLALVIYLLKPKSPRKNSEGFFGANGRTSGLAGKKSSQNCAYCRTRGGDVYKRQTKRNSEGFFGANGGTSRMKASLSSGSGCTVCDGGMSNYWAQGGRCKQGDRCVR